MYHSRSISMSCSFANSRIDQRQRHAVKRQVPRGVPRDTPTCPASRSRRHCTGASIRGCVRACVLGGGGGHAGSPFSQSPNDIVVELLRPQHARRTPAACTLRPVRRQVRRGHRLVEFVGFPIPLGEDIIEVASNATSGLGSVQTQPQSTSPGCQVEDVMRRGLRSAFGPDSPRPTPPFTTKSLMPSFTYCDALSDAVKASRIGLVLGEQQFRRALAAPASASRSRDRPARSRAGVRCIAAARLGRARVQDHVLRNHTVGSRCNRAAPDRGSPP